MAPSCLLFIVPGTISAAVELEEQVLEKRRELLGQIIQTQCGPWPILPPLMVTWDNSRLWSLVNRFWMKRREFLGPDHPDLSAGHGPFLPPLTVSWDNISRL